MRHMTFVQRLLILATLPVSSGCVQQVEELKTPLEVFPTASFGAVAFESNLRQLPDQLVAAGRSPDTAQLAERCKLLTQLSEDTFAVTDVLGFGNLQALQLAESQCLEDPTKSAGMLRALLADVAANGKTE